MHEQFYVQKFHFLLENLNRIISTIVDNQVDICEINSSAEDVCGYDIGVDMCFEQLESVQPFLLI